MDFWFSDNFSRVLFPVGIRRGLSLVLGPGCLGFWLARSLVHLGYLGRGWVPSEGGVGGSSSLAPGRLPLLAEGDPLPWLPRGMFGPRRQVSMVFSFPRRVCRLGSSSPANTACFRSMVSGALLLLIPGGCRVRAPSDPIALEPVRGGV